MKLSLAMNSSGLSAVARACRVHRIDTMPGGPDIPLFSRLALAVGIGERQGGDRIFNLVQSVVATLFKNASPSVPDITPPCRLTPAAGDGRRRSDGRLWIAPLRTAVAVVAMPLIYMVPMPPHLGRTGTVRWGSFFSAVREAHRTRASFGHQMNNGARRAIIHLGSQLQDG